MGRLASGDRIRTERETHEGPAFYNGCSECTQGELLVAAVEGPEGWFA